MFLSGSHAYHGKFGHVYIILKHKKHIRSYVELSLVLFKEKSKMVSGYGSKLCNLYWLWFSVIFFLLLLRPYDSMDNFHTQLLKLFKFCLLLALTEDLFNQWYL